jgi:hypothetical protein
MKVETYKIKGWREKETGLLIAENEEWVLVKHIPVDYMVDGYKLYQKKFIKKRISRDAEGQIAKVLQLKNVKAIPPKGFKFEGALDILKWVEKTYGLFEFQDKDESDLFYGRLNQIENDFFIIDMITADGVIEKEYEFDFSINKIRSITFESDYFESIRLLMLEELKTKR